ncbi:protein ANTAGONIST OF LIKE HETEROCHROMATIN PROTEIN 1-like [Salvia divinorum]|uniref:Protein ANTAGONIST OF LIKE HETEROCHROMATIN PROTEIN 1-like n=1 Tax=Salvia divinorum TaxID=28513 RepID=A0ABD1IFE9_SALDI
MDRSFFASTALYLMLEDIVNSFHMQSIVILYFYLKHMRHFRRRDMRRLIRHYSILDRIPAQVKLISRLTEVSDIDCFVNLRMDRNTFGRLCILLRDVGGLRPEPITNDCTYSRWKHFKGCLGALDETYINVLVWSIDEITTYVTMDTLVAKVS